jgi:hypothetical protein
LIVQNILEKVIVLQYASSVTSKGKVRIRAAIAARLFEQVAQRIINIRFNYRKYIYKLGKER